MDETKKRLKLPSWATYVLIGLEVALMVALVTIAFVVHGNQDVPDNEISSKLVLWLVQPENRVWFFILIVFPLIVLFLVNIYFLIRVMNEKTGEEFFAKTKEELLEEARRQAREEVLREMEASKAAEAEDK